MADRESNVMRGSGIHSSYLSLSYLLCHVYGLMLQFIAWWLIISPSGICLTASTSMGFIFHGIVSLPFSPHELTVCGVVSLFGSTSLTLKLVSPTQICFSPESIVATQMLIQVIKTARSNSYHFWTITTWFFRKWVENATWIYNPKKNKNGGRMIDL